MSLFCAFFFQLSQDEVQQIGSKRGFLAVFTALAAGTVEQGVADERLFSARSATEQKPNSEADSHREQNKLNRAALHTPGGIVDEIFHRVTPIFNCAPGRLHTIVDSICSSAESFANIAGLIH
jgi:hypothetical protein